MNDVKPQDDSVVFGPKGATEKESIRKLLRPGFWWCQRKRYTGSLLYNFGAFLLPALYETASKTWVAHVDPKQVIITDVYVYILVIANILNEGLPRAAWTVIGDKHNRSVNSRISLSYTLIQFQILSGLMITGVLILIADKIADAFVPDADRVTAVKYVRISSVVAFSSAMEVAVSNSTRALDRPDVPLIINSIKFAITALLDAAIISRARVGAQTSVINHASIRMACDLVSGACGLGYFIWIADRIKRPKGEQAERSKSRPCLASLEILVRHGVWTFGESIIRNSLYLWLVHGIIKISGDYATAWGVFNTIRGGILMVPLQALEASTLTFIGHKWGRWRKYKNTGNNETVKSDTVINESRGNDPGDHKTGKAKTETPVLGANKQSIFYIVSQAWAASSTGLAVEMFIFFLLFWAVNDFAYYLSQSHSVADIVQHMWRTMDWCYMFYAVSYQLAAILIATTPRFFFAQSLVTCVIWLLPWAITCSKVALTEQNAWTYHGVAFGGVLIVDFFTTIVACVLWGWMLHKGRVSLLPVTKEVEDEEAAKKNSEEKAAEKAEKKSVKAAEKARIAKEIAEMAERERGDEGGDEGSAQHTVLASQPSRPRRSSEPDQPADDDDGYPSR
ncbi:hypothetical protein LARI1_G006187 [Lachnellula arida]|uniref:Uncharacterized protein n=1 Tax=Lachnellula arida TaxID=1316785 RepID=A0A8T9B537_9HELO|nr:hypothetical protein LARI1_G006187 [Lachnellula arida]